MELFIPETMPPNNFLEGKLNKLCKSFGIKISTNAQVVQIAHNACYDSLFIDLEHGLLSLSEAANLCNVANLVGITPFVCVPHQCGNGFVQRVLDGGAMGVIFPHIETPAEATAAVNICKYPPLGCRSITGQAPLFGMRYVPPLDMIRKTNEAGSTVFVMVGNRRGVREADDIAKVSGLDAIVVAAQDLSVDMGIPGMVDSDEIRGCLDAVSMACWKYSKVFGVTGIYHNPELHDWVINILGARFMLVEEDTSILTAGATLASAAVPEVK